MADEQEGTKVVIRFFPTTPTNQFYAGQYRHLKLSIDGQPAEKFSIETHGFPWHGFNKATTGEALLSVIDNMLEANAELTDARQQLATLELFQRAVADMVGSDSQDPLTILAQVGKALLGRREEDVC